MLSARLTSFRQGMLRMCRAQFPKVCSTCATTFASFKDFAEALQTVGAPLLDTVEDEEPVGMLSFVNCRCGSTLTLQCEEPCGERHRAFNQAVRDEAATTGRTVGEILTELRELLREAGSSSGAEPARRGG
jgi:hypothetical protein